MHLEVYINMSDERTFARLLLEKRGKRTRQEIAKASGFNYQRLMRFEGGLDTISFPSEEELKVLIHVYGLDEEEANKALSESKEAKSNQRRIMIGLGKNYKPTNARFSGSLSSFRDIKRFNGGISNRYGRS